VYIRHLKKFLSSIKKLPSEKDAAAEREPSAAENRTQPDIEASSEAPSRMISRRLEPSKRSTIHEEPTLSTEHVDKRRRSTGHREKARSSTDRRSRRSVDCFDSILEHEQPEKPRKSFDRLVSASAVVSWPLQFAYFSRDEENSAPLVILSPTSLKYFSLLLCRIGEKIRAMGLCNVDCFKEPHDSGELSRGR